MAIETPATIRRLTEARVTLLRTKMEDLISGSGDGKWARKVNGSIAATLRSLTELVPGIQEISRLVEQSVGFADWGDAQRARLVFSEATQALVDFIGDKRRFGEAIGVAAKRIYERREAARSKT